MPRFGQGWAPDFVSAKARRGHDRADPERHRFLPPEPPPCDQQVEGSVFDPEAEPRPVGPQEAHEEQAIAD
eukprot:1304911-Pyramimonas_sp.AAC.1